MRPLHNSVSLEKTGHLDEISHLSEPTYAGRLIGGERNSKDRQMDVFNKENQLCNGLNMHATAVKNSPSALTYTFKLEPHVEKKVVAVALASIALFVFQLSLSWATALGLSFTFSLITIFCEKTLRSDPGLKNDWFNWDKENTQYLLYHVAFRIIGVAALVFLGTVSGTMPAQLAAELIMAGNLRIIFLAIIVAPIVEEVLFRGFLEERIHDILNLTSRYIYPLSQSTVCLLTLFSSALCFGSVHIIGNQVKKIGSKVHVLFGLTLFGLIASYFKYSYNSLLSPIAIHSAENTAMTLGLLAAARFTRSVKPLLNY